MSLDEFSPPRRIRTVLTTLRGRAAPASYDQALAARDAVVASSMRCAGEDACSVPSPPRCSAASNGVWPTWCTGVRTMPFTAHAWVEADGRPVGEPHAPGYYHPIITIPPAQRDCGSGRER